VIAIGLVCPSADAGDRKSSGRELQESKMEIFGSPLKTRTILVSGRSEQPGSSAGRLFEGSDSILASKRLGGHEEKGTSGEPKREHKSLTLFQFDSKLGEVKVQPVFGKVTGAQFSLGF
jgi:hypothetical protein